MKKKCQKEVDAAPFAVVQIKARDWGMVEGTFRADGQWEVSQGWLIGYLVGETENSISIAHQVFEIEGLEPHWKARYTSTIPKETIIERR